MSLPPKIVAAFALLILSSCGVGDCQFPAGWVVAATLKPSRSANATAPQPLFYAREVRPGSWSWQLHMIPSSTASSPSSTVTYQQLLENVAMMTSLSPRPQMVFSFADGQDCSHLNLERKRIVQAAGCSKDGPHCFEGTPEQLP